MVLKTEVSGDEACIKRLQEHVKATIAPYKYPRSVKFVDALPKTQTGKIQRFKLRTQSSCSSSIRNTGGAPKASQWRGRGRTTDLHGGSDRLEQ